MTNRTEDKPLQNIAARDGSLIHHQNITDAGKYGQRTQEKQESVQSILQKQVPLKYHSDTGRRNNSSSIEPSQHPKKQSTITTHESN